MATNKRAAMGTLTTATRRTQNYSKAPEQSDQYSDP
jgi:hypothetical protein